MATKQPAKRGANGKPFDSDVAWVNYALSPDQKAEVKTAPFVADEAALRIIEESYKISLSYDDFNECFTAFIIPKGDEHKHKGMILSGRGSTPIKALKQACYIHWNIFDADWSDARPSQREEIDD